MRETTYKLKKGTEFPVQYADITVTLPAPSTLDEVRGLFDAAVSDVDAAIVAGFNGQGYVLGRQKRVKELLNSEKYETRRKAGEDVATLAADAATEATNEKLGAPRTRGTGTKKDKVAAAEAKAEKATNFAKTFYLSMNASQRKQARPQMLAEGIFTEAELDEMDADLKK